MTATAPAQLLQRAALVKPKTADDATRSVELTIATAADCGDGVILRCAPGAVSWPGLVPVLMDHQNSVDRMAGRIESLRIEGGAVIGRAVFTDAPGADTAWPLARAGCAVSVGAQIQELRPLAGQNADEATRWTLRHVALVPQGQDPACLTRSLDSTSQDTTMTTANTAAPAAVTVHDTTEVERSAAEIKRENRILRMCNEANLGADFSRELIESGDPLDRAVVRVFEKIRDTKLSQAKTFAVVSPFAGSGASTSGDLAADLYRSMKGDGNREPLPYVVRDHLQINESNPGRIMARAFSSSDFVNALTAAGERSLLDAYQEAPEGVRSLAMSRVLADFRAVKMLRVSQFGAVDVVAEGGEYQAKSFSEEDAATLQAAQYGGIAVLSRIAAANDDLSIFDRLLEEMGRSAARKEAAELAARLGDITWDASNSLSSQTNLDVDAIAAAVLLLRRQADVDGNAVSFDPNLLVIAPEQEKEARQMLGSYQPNTAANVNPFSTLKLEVDHNLADGVAYLADTRYQPLGIGRVGGGPSMLREEDFSTGNLRFRIAHDFGTCAVDGRSIVKIAL